MAESEEELKSFLLKVKEEEEEAGLELSIHGGSTNECSRCGEQCGDSLKTGNGTAV